MRQFLILPILWLLAAPAVFAEPGGKPSVACNQQYQQCSKQCVSQREGCLESDRARETQGSMDESSKSLEHEKNENDDAMDSGRDMDEERGQDRSQAKERMEEKTNAMDKESKQAKDMKEKAKEKTDESGSGGKEQDDDGG